MGYIVNKKWVDEMVEKIEKGIEIDVTSSFHKSAQFLITELSENNVPFQVYNLGAGVRRITTITDICPCCKKSINRKKDAN